MGARKKYKHDSGCGDGRGEKETKRKEEMMFQSIIKKETNKGEHIMHRGRGKQNGR